MWFKKCNLRQNWIFRKKIKCNFFLVNELWISIKILLYNLYFQKGLTKYWLHAIGPRYRTKILCTCNLETMIKVCWLTRYILLEKYRPQSLPYEYWLNCFWLSLFDKIIRRLGDFSARNARKCSADVEMLSFRKSDEKCI